VLLIACLLASGYELFEAEDDDREYSLFSGGDLPTHSQYTPYTFPVNTSAGPTAAAPASRRTSQTIALTGVNERTALLA
jgi:hypothetical protein